jgi:urease accessory protein
VSDLSIADVSFVRLLQLVSPALPIGAFAYSHGIEAAVDLGFIDDAESAAAWIDGILRHSFATWEIPLFGRIYRGFERQDTDAVSRWNERLWASRASVELAEESRQLGIALARISTQLGIAEALSWWTEPKVTYEAVFALACTRWEIPVEIGARAYAFGSCEMLVSAATKLVPLGQTESQGILARLGSAVGPAADLGLSLADEDMTTFAPALAIASAIHETQYTRLFRS